MMNIIIFMISICFVACSNSEEDPTHTYSKIEVYEGHNDTIHAKGNINVTITDDEIVIDVNAIEMRSDTTISINFTENYSIDKNIITNSYTEYYSGDYKIVVWDSNVGLYAGKFFNYVIKE